MIKKIKKNLQNWQGVFTTIAIVSLVISGVRAVGWLQRWELSAMDKFTNLRPTEPIDDRIIIVFVTEDFKKPDTHPIPMHLIPDLIRKIRAQNPRVIGLEIFHNGPLSAGNKIDKKLREVFLETKNLIGISRLVEDEFSPHIRGDRILEKEKRVGAINVFPDLDGKIRRAFLYPNKDSDLPGFGLMLAKTYLKKEGFSSGRSPNGCLFFKKNKQDIYNYLKSQDVILCPFQKNDGGYVNVKDRGYQILVNWRGRPETFPLVKMDEVLKGRVELDLFRDKIVIIGVISKVVKERYYTPYTLNAQNRPTFTYGVEIQANFVSHIISSVLDNRPTIKVLSDPWEYFWITIWIAISGIIGWYGGRKPNNPLITTVVVLLPAIGLSFGVSYFCYWAFANYGYWIPIVPLWIGMPLTSITILGYIFTARILKDRHNLIRFSKKLESKNIQLEAAQKELKQYNLTLEQKVKERTKDLRDTVKQLNRTREKLQLENQLLRKAEDLSTYEYYIGGTVPLDSPTYVVRSADRELYYSLKRGIYCYILNARQMGKSSVCLAIVNQLKSEDRICCDIDMTEVTSPNTPEDKWYAGLAYNLVNRLGLASEINFRQWWRELDYLTARQRFSELISEVILKKTKAQIVIFFDEIDKLLSLKFPPDDFFSLLRTFYNKRTQYPEYKRLTFVFLGVASPAKLIQDKNSTPFNIGKEIILSPFQIDEVYPLAEGLKHKYDRPIDLLKEVLFWTGGQPFLTQKICYLILKSDTAIAQGEEKEWVENLVKVEILENLQSFDNPPHFQTIKSRLLSKQSSTKELLNLCQFLLENGEIIDDDSPICKELFLSGLVYKEKSKLKLYNPIYKAVFNSDWIAEELAELEPRTS